MNSQLYDYDYFTQREWSVDQVIEEFEHLPFCQFFGETDMDKANGERPQFYEKEELEKYRGCKCTFMTKEMEDEEGRVSFTRMNGYITSAH